MKIDITPIAKLSKLKIADSDREQYEAELSNILHLADKLQAVDTTGIEPMAHPMDLQQRLRADEVTETNQREKFQAIAPAVEEDLYLVPKVIESE